jgi:hypothetical protein
MLKLIMRNDGTRVSDKTYSNPGDDKILAHLARSFPGGNQCLDIGCNVASNANASNVGVVRATHLSAAVLARWSELGLDHRHRVGEHDLRPTRSNILVKAFASTDYTHRSRTMIT